MTVDPRIPVPRFKLGDHVKISPSCEFYGDWMNEKLIIVGLGYSRDQREILYTTLEASTFQDILSSYSRHLLATGRTDEWNEADLTFFV